MICQLLLNSTLLVDKGTWKFTVEAGTGNTSTFDQYDHILDVLVFGKLVHSANININNDNTCICYFQDMLLNFTRMYLCREAFR